MRHKFCYPHFPKKYLQFYVAIKMYDLISEYQYILIHALMHRLRITVPVYFYKSLIILFA